MKRVTTEPGQRSSGVRLQRARLQKVGELSARQGIQDRPLEYSGRETKLYITSGISVAQTPMNQAADITRLGIIFSLCTTSRFAVPH